MIKHCQKCGARYTIKTWRTLKHIGDMSDGRGGRLELRSCECESTLAMQIETREAS